MHSWRGLYAILDPDYCRMSPQETARALIVGGAAVVQLRAKSLGDRDLLALARELASLCRDASIPFVMNDRLDLALLCDADGLHLGQDDLPLDEARAHFDGSIGVSTHSVEQAKHAAKADLIGFGPIFPTASKRDPDPVVGPESLAEICAFSGPPVVAIGGMTATRAREAYDAGATLVAALSALCAAPDPRAAAEAFRRVA